MDLIKSIPIGAGRLELWVGDLAGLSAEDDTDLLVVSAFRGDYAPTAGSLIGALDRRGLSAGDLAGDPEADLRSTSSCWLSRPIVDGRERFGIERVLCYEPILPGVAGAIVGDIFRAMVPFVGQGAIRDVAMPILASGDQGQSREVMMASVVDAASHWMLYGLDLERLRIVVQSTRGIAPLLTLLELAEGTDAAVDTGRAEPGGVFLSYAHADGADVAETMYEHLQAVGPIEVFLDRVDLEVGSAWQSRIARAIERSLLVVAVVTPGYCDSVNCAEEFVLASVLHERRGGGVLHPILARKCKAPEHIARLTFDDCREGDLDLARQACDRVLAASSNRRPS